MSDVGRISDFDVAVTGDDIFKKADELGLVKGDRTGPIDVGSKASQNLGINELLKKMSSEKGRPISIMIFKNAEAIKQKAASIRIPTQKDGF